MAAAIGAYASVQNAAINAFYKVNVGTPQENCIPFQSLKECEAGLPTCIDFIPALGSVQQIYLNMVPIPDTDRFECIEPMEEIL